MRRKLIYPLIFIFFASILAIGIHRAYWYFVASEQEILNVLAEKEIGNIWIKSKSLIPIEDDADRALMRRNIYIRREVKRAIDSNPEVLNDAWKEALEKKPVQIEARIDDQDISWIESQGEICSSFADAFDANLKSKQGLECFKEVDLPMLFPNSGHAKIQISPIRDVTDPKTKDFLVKKSLEQIITRSLVKNFRKEILIFGKL